MPQLAGPKRYCMPDNAAPDPASKEHAVVIPSVKPDFNAYVIRIEGINCQGNAVLVARRAGLPVALFGGLRRI